MKKSEFRTNYKILRKKLSSKEIDDLSLQIANSVLKLPIWRYSFFHIFLTIKPLKEVQIKDFVKENNNNREFFIYVGSLHKRKNIERMLRGFKKFNSENKMDFIIVGTDMWKNQLNLDGLLNNVKFLGRKSGDQLVNWVASSSALIYVSYFEGFGLPVLEGMMSGVPVVTSNLTSMPEVGGDSVIYVDPFNEDSISQGMKKATGNNQELIEKAFNQAKKFSWDKSALEVKDLLLNSKK